MSKERFKCYYCNGIENIIVEDTINNETYIEDNIVNLLNQQDQRIAELEEQLKNAIVPKFRIGQEVYKVYTPNQKYPFEFKIIGFKITKSKGEDNIFYNVEEDGFDMGWYPDEILFATKEEAQAKLEELKGE